MQSNEQLVDLVQAGDTNALLQLWEQVRRLVLKYAGRWAAYGGAEADDLMQAGFIAVMRAAETFDSSSETKFSTYLVPVLKTEFTRATGQRTRKQQMDPLQSAASLDVPLLDDENGDTFGDLVPDPTAEAAFEAVDEADRLEHLRTVLEETIDRLSPAQQNVIRKKYYRRETLSGYDRTLHNKAMVRLRHPVVSRQLMELMR